MISSSVKVSLNDKKIPIKGFSQYVDMYLKKEGEDVVKFTDKTAKNDRWELIVSHSDDQFRQVSFVNSICTSSGGSHVTYIMDQISNRIQEAIKKKHKDLNIKPFQIRNHLAIFLNTLIENPAFSSQTKEVLTTKPSQFGSKYEVSEKMLKDILKSGILDQIVKQAMLKEKMKMERTLQAGKKSRLLGIPKLEDANDAGTRNAEYCTLILTEGDSAKSLAMAGIEVVGRDRYGVFPLKGKMLNVRDAKFKDISKNEEVQNLIKILGLQVNKEYESVKQLRYGSIMIMADQDQDGSHIKGLIINFIHHFWPSLVFNNKFIREFVTPLIKASKGTQVKPFFTVNDFRIWAQTIDIKKWKIKYYKGLGTSDDKEAKEYFANINKHTINFKYAAKEDDDAIDLAFNKGRADSRKEWLKTHDPENTVNHNEKQLRYVDFVNKELLQFSYYDTMRSIPSLCDGLKPGQRKILYACFKRNLKDEIKVAQLSGYVAEHSAYHHGETSLAQTIIGMAQNFVGSNNINLLMPNGQFGSRSMGGKDAASARYLHTNLSKITRHIFNEDDDHLYKYLEDDGQMVEPEWYLPIIPMVLVNGADGIGTGWSTSIPCYNPREIAKSLRARLNGEGFHPMRPWFKGFNGAIEPSSKENGFIISGKYEVLDDDNIRISELPVRKWTRDYKNYLEEMLNPKEGEKEAEIEDIKEYHTNNTVDFVIRMTPGRLKQIIKNEGIEKKFKINSSLSTTNMVLFDPHGKPKRYGCVEEIMEDFYQLRIQFYEKRKEYLLSKLEKDLELLENKKRFILAVIAEDIKVRNVKKKAIVQDLANKGYRMMKDFVKVKSTKIEKHAALPKQESEMDEENDDEEAEVSAKEYNYLLSMPIWSLTFEKVEQLKREYEKKAEELVILRNTAISNMYEKDLDLVLRILGEVEDKEQTDDAQTRKKQHSKESILKLAKSKSSNGATKKKPKKKTKMVNSEGEEESEPESDPDDDFALELKKQRSKGDKGEKGEKAKPKESKAMKKSMSLKSSQDSEEKGNETSMSQPVAGEKEKAKARPKVGRLRKNGKPIEANKENDDSTEMKEETNLQADKSKAIEVEDTKEKEKEKEKVQEKEKKSYSMTNSILKYLVKKPKENTDSQLPKDETSMTSLLSLSDRIRQRELAGITTLLLTEY